MNLIQKFMKIGGFKTPEELEAYGDRKLFMIILKLGSTVKERWFY